MGMGCVAKGQERWTLAVIFALSVAQMLATASAQAVDTDFSSREAKGCAGAQVQVYGPSHHEHGVSYPRTGSRGRSTFHAVS